MSKETDTIYYRQHLAVPETPFAGQLPEPWGPDTVIIGKPEPRVDGYERVSGTAVYPSDVQLPRMLYAASLTCPHPHAKVKSIDASRAEQMPGVAAVLVPDSPEVKGLKWDWGQGYRRPVLETQPLFEGETVAAVAAENPYIAHDALRAIKVEYEVLPFVSDERRALDPDAPKVHPDGNRIGEPDEYERGDTAKGFEEADVVMEREYRTACELHTPMELHGCVIAWEGDRLTVWESTQGVYSVQQKVAATLGVPLSKVRVIGHYMGGGFGSKLWTSKYSVIAALFGRMTGRPVRMFLPRELTYLTMGNRPAANMKLKAGVKKDGTLTALEFEDLGTGGAFPSGGTALVDWLVRDNWLCPNVKTKTTDVFINAGLTRPFRAPGHPQCSWALEQMLDDLAEAIEMDPVQLRLKNVPRVSQGRPGNPPYTSTGLAECIKQGAEVFEWSKSRAEAEAFNQENQDVKRGVGMAGAVWFVGGGGPPSTVVIKVFSDGSVNLNMGASDIGTGTKTIMAMVAAEELGVKPEVIQIENADTGATQYATPSGGSKTVPTEAPAVRSAALDAKRQILIWAAEDLDAEVEDLVYEGQWVRSKADPDNKVKVADISGLNKRGVAMGVGYRGPNPGNKSVNPFAAQFCEVEINVKTGQMNIRRFVGAHESGRVMDRLTFDCQIYGGITMGIGLAATEFRVLDQGQTGKLLNRNWHDYKLPTALDVPTNITPVAIDMPDPEANITGAKGLGEPVTIPTASAVANAVYHALGRRALESPINPISLTRLMSENDKEG